MSNPGGLDARCALQARRYELGTPETPAALRRCFDRGQPRAVTARGDLAILDGPLTAFFCSIRCPGAIILRIYDLAREFRRTNITLIGGFHSPMEKEFLDLLLRGTARVVVCPARSIEHMLVPREWRPAVAEGRLLILSPFGRSHRRPTAALAAQRNDVVAALATDAFIPYAAPGGRTEALARQFAGSGKCLRTLDSLINANLLALGARVTEPTRRAPASQSGQGSPPARSHR